MQPAETEDAPPISPPVLDLPKDIRVSEKQSTHMEKSFHHSIVSSSNQSRRLKTFTRHWSPVKYKWPKKQAKGFLRLKYQNKIISENQSEKGNEEKNPIHNMLAGAAAKLASKNVITPVPKMTKKMSDYTNQNSGQISIMNDGFVQPMIGTSVHTSVQKQQKDLSHEVSFAGQSMNNQGDCCVGIVCN